MPDRPVIVRATLCGALVVALGVTVASPPRPRFLWNASASAPIGLWRIEPGAPPRRGDMVAATLGEPWRSFAARRRYLPSNVPLIKRVAARSGDRICASGNTILVNDVKIASRVRFDGAERPMPEWRGCTTLGPDELLLLMEVESSFDGRYFGPTKSGDLIGKATPLWLP
ncbi:S26 family signal peptidase [Sphingopyxis sp. LARHCG72]